MTKTLLNFDQLQEVLANLPPNAFVAGFFISFANVSQDEWLNPLAGYLQERGFVTVALLTPRSLEKCNLDQARHIALVSPLDVAKLGRINVFIISDMDHSSADFPQCSRVLGVWHGFNLATDSPLPLSISYAASLDGWLCPYPFSDQAKKNIKELWSGMVARDTSPRHGKFMQLIPCGSPRMAILEQKLANLKQKPDAIIFAPIRCNYALERGGKRLHEHGIKTIQTLLDNFPRQTIIFRPYREDIDSEIVQAICAQFAENPKFCLDQDSDRLPAFARGQLLVTDFSHIGQSFAFSTKRPAIFFEPWAHEPVQKNIWGIYANSYAELIAQVNYCLTNAKSISENIASLLHTKAMPYSHAFAEIHELLPDFYEQRRRDDWIEIKRLDQAEVPTAWQYIKKFINLPDAFIPALALTASVYARPGSLLLTAFTIHYHLLQDPQRLIFHNFRLILRHHLNTGKEYYRYTEIEFDAVRHLYIQAIRQESRNCDETGRQMAEALLKKFNSRFKTA